MSLKSQLISDCKKIYWKLGRPEIRSGDKHPNYRLRLQKKYEFFLPTQVLVHTIAAH